MSKLKSTSHIDKDRIPLTSKLVNLVRHPYILIKSNAEKTYNVSFNKTLIKKSKKKVLINDETTPNANA